MNIVFIGASKFGLRCLKLLNEMDCCHVSGVVTAPKTFQISYRPEGVTNVLHADIPSFCRERAIQHTVIETGMNETALLELVRSWEPHAFIVIGWYHIIPKIWRDLAPAYGMHASLLPDYSGGAPLVWAMINGEKKTGITLFKMDSKVDSGMIAGQTEELIKPKDTIATLYGRIEDRGLELLNRHIPELATGMLELKPQDESKRRTFPQRSPEDGLINWEESAETIDRFVRAQTRPYPGAFSILDDKPLRIWSSRTIPNYNRTTPSKVIRKNNEYFVCCKDGLLQIFDISFSGRDYNSSFLQYVFGNGGQLLRDNSMIDASSDQFGH